MVIQNKRRRVRTHGENAYGLFTLVVSRVERLSPSYIRVSLVGPALQYAARPIALGGLSNGLDRDDTAFSHSTDDGESYIGVLDGYIKLLIPPAAQRDEHGRISALQKKPVHIDLNDSWRQDWFAQPESQRGWMRTYTLRASRLRVPVQEVATIYADLPTQPVTPEGLAVLPQRYTSGTGVGEYALPEIDIDFVLHAESDADGIERMGPGATWASLAQVGDRVSILAPLAGQPLWASWSDAGASRIVMAVDETAIPAALSILAEYALDDKKREDVEIHLVAEVPHAADSLEALWGGGYPLLPRLRELEWVKIHWCAREDAPRGEALATGLRSLLNLEGVQVRENRKISPEKLENVDNAEVVWTLADDENPQIYVFIAGEASVVKTLRRICVQEASIPKNDVSFMGYWKAGRTES